MGSFLRSTLNTRHTRSVFEDNLKFIRGDVP